MYTREQAASVVSSKFRESVPSRLSILHRTGRLSLRALPLIELVSSTWASTSTWAWAASVACLQDLMRQSRCFFHQRAVDPSRTRPWRFCHPESFRTAHPASVGGGRFARLAELCERPSLESCGDGRAESGSAPVGGSGVLAPSRREWHAFKVEIASAVGCRSATAPPSDRPPLPCRSRLAAPSGRGPRIGRC